MPSCYWERTLVTLVILVEVLSAIGPTDCIFLKGRILVEQIINIFTHLSEPGVLKEYSEYLVLIIMIASFLEVVFPPIPGDTVLVVCGSLAGAAEISPVLLIVMAAVGSFGASFLLYRIGVKLDEKMLDSSKFAWILDSKGFAKVKQWFGKYGFLTVLFSRLLPIFRSGIIFAAGISKMNQVKALSAVGISTIFSTSLFVMGGYLMGERWQKVLDLWNSQMRVVLIAAVVVLILLLLINKLRQKSKERGV